MCTILEVWFCVVLREAECISVLQQMLQIDGYVYRYLGAEQLGRGIVGIRYLVFDARASLPPVCLFYRLLIFRQFMVVGHQMLVDLQQPLCLYAHPPLFIAVIGAVKAKHAWMFLDIGKCMEAIFFFVCSCGNVLYGS